MQVDDRENNRIICRCEKLRADQIFLKILESIERKTKIAISSSNNGSQKKKKRKGEMRRKKERKGVGYK